MAAELDYVPLPDSREGADPQAVGRQHQGRGRQGDRAASESQPASASAEAGARGSSRRYRRIAGAIVAATRPATPYDDPQTHATNRARRTPPRRAPSAPWADALFSVLAHVAAWLTLALLAGIIVSLVVGAAPAIQRVRPRLPVDAASGIRCRTSSAALVLIYGTLVTSLIALLIAVPVSFGIALFLTELSPAWLKRPLGTAIELLAAMPVDRLRHVGPARVRPLLRDLRAAAAAGACSATCRSSARCSPGRRSASACCRPASSWRSWSSRSSRR